MFNLNRIKELELRLNRLEQETRCNKNYHDWEYQPKRNYGTDLKGNIIVFEEGIYCKNCCKMKEEENAT